MPTTDTEPAHDPERLLRLARAGCETALGGLLERYRNYLLLLARLGLGGRLRGKLDEADVVQEAFLKAGRDFRDFRGATEPELAGWLRQVLARTLANQVRRYARTGKRDIGLERSLAHELDRSSRLLSRGVADPGTSPSGRAARGEQAVLLADALGALPPDHREAIVLRSLEGLPFAEVGVRMERSEDAVKKLWARALCGLRRQLGSSDGSADAN